VGYVLSSLGLFLAHSACLLGHIARYAPSRANEMASKGPRNLTKLIDRTNLNECKNKTPDKKMSVIWKKMMKKYALLEKYSLTLHKD